MLNTALILFLAVAKPTPSPPSDVSPECRVRLTPYLNRRVSTGAQLAEFVRHGWTVSFHGCPVVLKIPLGGPQISFMDLTSNRVSAVGILRLFRPGPPPTPGGIPISYELEHFYVQVQGVEFTDRRAPHRVLLPNPALDPDLR